MLKPPPGGFLLPITERLSKALRNAQVKPSATPTGYPGAA